MRRLTDFFRGSAVPAATLNGIQNEQVGLIPATDTPDLALTGADGRWWTTPDAGVADGTTRTLDDSVDWRARVFWGVFQRFTAADQRPGEANDHTPNDPTSAVVTRPFEGWSGTGGLGTASAAVEDGVPPVLADNAFALVLDELGDGVDRIYLYADPNNDGALCLYNDSGATLHGRLRVFAAGEVEDLGAAPSPIPTITPILYLGQGNVADRPTPNAETRGVYYASDEGVFYYWDGTVWTAWGGGASGPTAIDGDASTTDATWTSIATVAMDPSTSTTLRISVAAIRDDGTEGGGWELVGRYRRPSAGSAVAGAETFLLADHDGTGWDVRVTPGASGLTIEVQGEAAVNLNWRCVGTATSRSA